MDSTMQAVSSTAYTAARGMCSPQSAIRVPVSACLKEATMFINCGRTVAHAYFDCWGVPGNTACSDMIEVPGQYSKQQRYIMFKVIYKDVWHAGRYNNGEEVFLTYGHHTNLQLLGKAWVFTCLTRSAMV